jgi:membrane protein
MGERRLGLVAAGVGFFAMLALFPGLAAVIALTGFWADPSVVRESLEMAAEFVPEDAYAILSDQITRLVSDGGQSLGWASLVSLAAAIWSARLGVGALAQGLNAIYGGTPRSGLREVVLALALTGLLIGVGVISVAAILLTPILLALVALFVPQDNALFWLAEILRWSVALGAMIVGLGLFYRYGPNRADGQRSPFLSAGLALAILLWGAASAGFTVFLNNFGNYNEIYGSIGAVIALLMWLYISAYAVLIGGALNYVLEKRDPAPAR